MCLWGFQSIAAAAAVEQQKHLSLLFSRASIMPIPLDPLGKEIWVSIDNFALLLQVTLSINIQYTNLWADPTGVFNRLSYRALYLLVKAVDIDRQFHIPISQTIGIDRQFHVPIGHSNRYRSTMCHTYPTNNTLSCRLIRTYWSKK